MSAASAAAASANMSPLWLRRVRLLAGGASISGVGRKTGSGCLETRGAVVRHDLRLQCGRRRRLGGDRRRLRLVNVTGPLETPSHQRSARFEAHGSEYQPGSQASWGMEVEVVSILLMSASRAEP